MRRLLRLLHLTRRKTTAQEEDKRLLRAKLIAVAVARATDLGSALQ